MQKTTARTPEDLFEIPPDSTVSIDAVLATIGRGRAAAHSLIEIGGYDNRFAIAHPSVMGMVATLEACLVQIEKMVARL